MRLSLFFILSFPLFLFSQTVNVSNSTELQNALNTAIAGQTIVLANGTYNQSGGFSVNSGIHGTASKPITLKGSSFTIISANSTATGYGFWLKGNNYWVLDGFTVRNSKKAIMLDNSHYNKIKNIKVSYIGDEGIHLRTYSSYNLVDACYVDSVGIVSGTTGTAEAIYVGSSKSNWATYTAGNGDTCNFNTISNNSFGDNIPSENIDIKEGTSYGTVSNNTFNGKGLNSINSGDSWVDVKGNYYKIECNTGSNSVSDGFQTHILTAGFGDYNTFSSNTATSNVTGYVVNIQSSGSQGTAPNNKVCNNNTATGAAKGISNTNTQSCTASCIITNSSNNSKPKSIHFPNPAKDVIHLVGIDSTTSYLIYDATGSLMSSGQVQNSAIDISNLANGLYFISLPSLFESFKVIKK